MFQFLVQQISAYISHSEAAREEVDEIIRKTAIPQFLRFAVTEAGRFRDNWLPTPGGEAFSLTLRTYVPEDVVKQGKWFLPSVKMIA